MLDLRVGANLPQTVADFDFAKLASRQIEIAAHCFGCTAGAGSSCGGVVVNS